MQNRSANVADGVCNRHFIGAVVQTAAAPSELSTLACTAYPAAAVAERANSTRSFPTGSSVALNPRASKAVAYASDMPATAASPSIIIVATQN